MNKSPIVFTLYVFTQYLCVWDAKHYTERKKNSMNNQTLDQSDTTNDTEKKSAENACCVIYGLQNKLKPEKWYIGQSWCIEVRWRKYKYLACKRQPKIYNALLKYGYDGFEKIIVETLYGINQTELDEAETKWIKHYDSVDNGYNLNYGGNAPGRKSSETKQKIRMRQTGKTNSFYGRTHANEVKEFLRKRFTGRVFSAEWRAKLSEAAKRRVARGEKMLVKSACSKAPETSSPPRVAG